jgi:CubicO group peptidase (beta-lactamase class C family)
MTKVNAALQDLLDRNLSNSKAHGLLLDVQSADGRIDFRGSAGKAVPETRFPIASISKTYTATMILQLVDERRLTLDQPVQSALPDIDLSRLHVVKGSDQTARLTIRQLLFQTSGLADYYEGGVAEDLIRSRDYAHDLTRVLEWARAGPARAAPDSGSWMTLWRPSAELIGHSGASGTFAFHAPERDIYLVGTFNQTDIPKRPFSLMLQALRAVEKHGCDA